MTTITISECQPVYELTQMECCTSRPLLVMTKSTCRLHSSNNAKVLLILIAEAEVGEESPPSMSVSWQIQSRLEQFLMKANRLIIALFQVVQRKKQRHLGVRDLATWAKQQLRTTCSSTLHRCKPWSVLVQLQSPVRVRTIIIGVGTRIPRKATTLGTLAETSQSHPCPLSRKRSESHISRKINKNSMLRRLTNPTSVIAQTNRVLKVGRLRSRRIIFQELLDVLSVRNHSKIVWARNWVKRSKESRRRRTRKIRKWLKWV